MFSAKSHQSERHRFENKVCYRCDSSVRKRGKQISHKLHSARESDPNYIFVHWQDQWCDIFHLPVREMESNKHQVSGCNFV